MAAEWLKDSRNLRIMEGCHTAEHGFDILPLFLEVMYPSVRQEMKIFRKGDAAMADKVRTTMTVLEMGRMLGLKKTESYYLVHKQYFDTLEIAGSMRIVIDSFETWYASQTKYCKTDGPEPGSALKARSYSVKEISELLMIHESSAYDLVRKKNFPTEVVNGAMRIPKEAFESWYASQSHYRTAQDKERDKELEESSLSLPEMASLLGVPRSHIYSLLRSHPEAFDIVMIAGRRRVTKESFEAWYSGQHKYTKVSDRPVQEQKELRLKEKIKEAPRLEVDPDKPSYSVKETAVLLDLPEKDVYLLIRGGELEAKRIGRVIRISRDDINWFLVQHQKYKDSI